MYRINRSILACRFAYPAAQKSAHNHRKPFKVNNDASATNEACSLVDYSTINRLSGRSGGGHE